MGGHRHSDELWVRPRYQLIKVDSSGAQSGCWHLLVISPVSVYLSKGSSEHMFVPQVTVNI